MLVKEIAALLAAPFEGDGDREIRRAAPIESARADEVTFVSSPKAATQAVASAAGLMIVPAEYLNDAGQTIIRVADPRSAIGKAIERLYPKREPTPGVHATAVLGPGVVLGAGVSIGPYTSVGAGVHLGESVALGSGCSIGDYVRIGDHSVIHPAVTIYPETRLGKRVIVHSGSVLGADGFGFVMRSGRWESFPQIGRVEIGDSVEIGANSCIDRAALGVTSVGEGTKLDNMVHIGHNCAIGRHVVIAAQTGLAGGVIIEDYAVIGGQVGVGDKARIESRAIVGSGAGILTSKIVRAGQPMWGTPARPLREHLEQLAALARLPEVLKEWRELKKKLS